jgi:hypothetical protein
MEPHKIFLNPENAEKEGKKRNDEQMKPRKIYKHGKLSSTYGSSHFKCGLF